mmetsp:Transcript_7766/g.31157  ORF Transcript_7766/g.31157 Transcript_7766/m.31157 type:complete len:294 (-) Transcript_7766:53-934(-)
MYSGLPHTVRIVCPSGLNRANPKSMSFTVGRSPSSLNKIFSNFKSLCTISLACMCATACNTCVITDRASSSANDPTRDTRSSNSPPWTSSQIINTFRSVTYVAYSSTTFTCRISESTSTSRSNDRSVGAYLLLSTTLMATSRPVAFSRARATVLNPPVPIFSSTSYASVIVVTSLHRTSLPLIPRKRPPSSSRVSPPRVLVAAPSRALAVAARILNPSRPPRAPSIASRVAPTHRHRSNRAFRRSLDRFRPRPRRGRRRARAIRRDNSPIRPENRRLPRRFRPRRALDRFRDR